MLLDMHMKICDKKMNLFNNMIRARFLNRPNRFLIRCEWNGKILKHLGLWDLKVRPPPKVKAPSVTISIDDSDSQVPFSAPSFYSDPDYPMDSQRILKPRGVTPLVVISVMNPLFPTPQKGEDFHIFTWDT